MRINTSLGPVVIRKNSPFYGDGYNSEELAEYAAIRAALRYHRANGGKATRAFARLDSQGKYQRYWEVTLIKPLDNVCVSVEGRLWLTTIN